MTKNQQLLAKMLTDGVIARARTPDRESPQEAVMAALAEAIQAKREALVFMALVGDKSEVRRREANAQLERWEAAWRANR